MGKGRRRRRRSEAAKLAAEFAKQSRQRFLDDAISSDRFRAEASNYIRSIVRIEEDILSRTVFVTDIMDLNRPGNLDELCRFFEQRYGPVKSCEKTSYNGRRNHRGKKRYPPARVQFLHKTDAEKLFGGMELLRVNKAVKIDCPVGRRLPSGLHQIYVRPSQKYTGMAEDELKASVISFETLALSLGHYCPFEKEIYDFPPDDAEKEGSPDEWLEEVRTDTKISFRVDLRRRVIELASSGSDELVSSSFLGAMFDSLNLRNFCSFRFKALDGPIELCHDSESPNEYSLIFSLKYPPKLETEVLNVGLDLMGPERMRDVKFGNVQAGTFGRCLGFRLRVPEAAVDRLVLNESLNRLKAFGILRRGLLSLQNSKEILSKDIGSGRERLDAEMQRIHSYSPKAGKRPLWQHFALVSNRLLTLATRANCKVCWCARCSTMEDFAGSTL